MNLGVNLDHIATLRQARRTFEPDPVKAVLMAELGGADGIVVHLREDRRHIQDRDLRLMREVVTTKLNLEMGLSEEIIEIALQIKPDQVTLVPEKREELTTEGGLDVVKERKRVEEAVRLFKKNKIPVSLFIEPVREQLDAAKAVGAKIIELHTGKYANASDDESRRQTLLELSGAAYFARDLKLFVAAGHGLTYNNVEPITGIKAIWELNIGHSIIARAVMVGLERAVRDMKELIQ